MTTTKPNPPIEGMGSGGLQASGQEAAPSKPSASETLPPASSAPQVAEQSPADSVVIGRQVLPLQPVITARSVALNVDLASQLPTTPVSTKTPMPPKSAGLLSSLTSSLAGTVVPQLVAVPVVHLVTLLLSRAAQPLLLLVFAFVFTFGLWIRRAGFQTAARSDGAAYLSFATPFLMGYVPALPQTHSPFLVVAETKTFSVTFRNALRKEEMV